MLTVSPPQAEAHIMGVPMGGDTGSNEATAPSQFCSLPCHASLCILCSQTNVVAAGVGCCRLVYLLMTATDTQSMSITQHKLPADTVVISSELAGG